MACNESDDKSAILDEISRIKEELASLNKRAYDISTRDRLLRHRLYDLEYDLKEINGGESDFE